uniref:Uncharacterized protein n=1 Tax=Rhizophora mucronata TaxID=61149 RepID=A0A2P2R0S1_RHIMU
MIQEWTCCPMRREEEPEQASKTHVNVKSLGLVLDSTISRKSTKASINLPFCT